MDPQKLTTTLDPQKTQLPFTKLIHLQQQQQQQQEFDVFFEENEKSFPVYVVIVIICRCAFTLDKQAKRRIY